MPKIYGVTVKPDYRWSNVQVAGRPFSKTSVTEINEADMNEEILNSPLLKVEVIPEPEPEPGSKKSRRRRKGNSDDDSDG